MRLTFFLLLCSGTSVLCYAQQTDTVKVFYNPDEYRLQRENKSGLDAFIKQGWDYITIRSYTDETDGDDYNLNLSKRRGEEVQRYLAHRNIAANNIRLQYFGEAAPLADNNTDEGRALNRQTTIVGYRYPRITRRQAQSDKPADPMKPVTTTMSNGFIITYRPGAVSESLREYFEAGTAPFQLVTNTTEMRQTGLYTNTTRGEVLSSVIVFCGQASASCKLDSPVLVKVPIPFQTSCPIEKIQCYNAVAEIGRQLWQEQNKQLVPEVIDGKQYLGVWMDNLCQCINFDIKIPECYEVDSTLLLVNTKIRNLTTELVGLNSVYIPRKATDSTHSVMFVKDQPDAAMLSFSAYYGKKFLRSFRNKPVTAFPYNAATKSYVLKLDSVSFYLPKFKDYFITLRVNGDRYKTFFEKENCQVVYLKRKDENITVDLWLPGKKGRPMEYKAQPLSSIPFDAAKGRYVIDKAFVKELELRKAVTKR